MVAMRSYSNIAGVNNNTIIDLLKEWAMLGPNGSIMAMRHAHNINGMGIFKPGTMHHAQLAHAPAWLEDAHPI